MHHATKESATFKEVSPQDQELYLGGELKLPLKEEPLQQEISKMPYVKPLNQDTSPTVQ